MCEYQLHDPSTCWFLTLTYDDEHLPLVPGADSLGEFQLVGSLRPRDMTLFLKRLRKCFSDAKIRFFYCGEYGECTKRPHYHMIVFGLPLKESELEFLTTTKQGDNLWKCDLLDRIWKNGHVTVGQVSIQSCAYVARYCMKKIGSCGDSFRFPEFIRMSRSPGIGFDWLALHPDIFEVSSFSLPTKDGAQKFLHPRYYLSKLREFDESKWNELHDLKLSAGELSYKNSLLDPRDYLSQLRAKELTLHVKCGRFKRNLD